MADLMQKLVVALIVVAVAAVVGTIIYIVWRNKFREAKNIERGLKMVPMRIHLPPISDDVEGGARDARDLTEEIISQAQVMYNVIASTATSGFRSKIYGQRHISFEIVSKGGLIHYFVVAPTVLTETIKQAVSAAYPTARLEEIEENNVFSEIGKINGTIGGEFALKKSYENPIATFQESKRDSMRAIINALSVSSKEDGVGIQILIRPARTNWAKKIEKVAKDIRDGKKAGGLSGNWMGSVGDMLEVLWKPPSASKTEGQEPKTISGADQAKIESLEEKARYSGFETMIRLVASSNTASRSQALLQNVVSVFSLFDSPTGNGFKFNSTTDVKKFVTDYIFRIFPQEKTSMILNTVELSTIFHLPDQTNIPTSQVERQSAKQVDGPSVLPEHGLLLGYNEFRGVKKPIRLQTDDRRRHTYVIGQTGMGKTVFLENLALQDMRSGLGFAFIDPHGDSAEKLLSLVPRDRVDDVIYFNPGDFEHPIGMNIYEVDKTLSEAEQTRQIDFMINEVVEMFVSLFDPNNQGIVGPRMTNIVRYASLLLLSDPSGGTFMDVPKILRDPVFAKSKMQYLKNVDAIDFWTKEWPAAQRSNEAGEVSSWVISKWAKFSTSTMRNILGQLHSGLDLNEIMNNRKILIVNLSKGALGEEESKLLGMMFVMRLQAAAMQRVKIPESERQDFCLYVDEFQNFATESFASIMSEARKFRLNLIVANQFMTQLKDTIREAIIGNMGTVVCGRIGVTDAELMVKKFEPVFDVSDLQNIPNHEAVAETLINGTPTQAFTMHLPAPMGETDEEVREYIKKLSRAKYGRNRAEVEAEINARLQTPASPTGSMVPSSANLGDMPKPSGNGSFLDNWLKKRQELSATSPVSTSAQAPAAPPTTTTSAQMPPVVPTPASTPIIPPPTPPTNPESQSNQEISVDLR
ncbi:MAG: ATP-binding protein [Candidatus Nomurabacteria bacterium]|jgi:hypothetical protein|nr:ATP-binding protein [Candidatus Nomurabacteria bacterium]